MDLLLRSQGDHYSVSVQGVNINMPVASTTIWANIPLAKVIPKGHYQRGGKVDPTQGGRTLKVTWQSV